MVALESLARASTSEHFKGDQLWGGSQTRQVLHVSVGLVAKVSRTHTQGATQREQVRARGVYT